MKPKWDCTYGNIAIFTDNDQGYDWGRKNERYQLTWEPPEKEDKTP